MPIITQAPDATTITLTPTEHDALARVLVQWERDMYELANAVGDDDAFTAARDDAEILESLFQDAADRVE